MFRKQLTNTMTAMYVRMLRHLYIGQLFDLCCFKYEYEIRNVMLIDAKINNWKV